MHVARELLDKQIVDRDGTRLGRVDALVAELRPGRPPRIVQLELGFVPLARRIHRRLEAVAEACHRRWSIRRSARWHLDWTRVLEVNRHHVVVDVKAAETVALDWERWLRRHVIGRIRGAARER